jgi:protein-S-isoprenylcysteine O-methyltransferase Ste14
MTSALPLSDLLDHLGVAIYWPLPLTLWPIPAALAFWAVFLWARARERTALAHQHVSNDPASNLDKGSWPLINHGWRLVRLAALLVAFVTPPWVDGGARYALFGLGLGLMICGALLRQHCFRMLGEHFTYEVKVSAKSQVVKRGLYRWVRHPSYTGGMLYNFGIGLALTNWRSTVLVVVGMLVMYLYRVHVEERALLQMHHDDYGEYMRQTKRFVPFVY